MAPGRSVALAQVAAWSAFGAVTLALSAAHLSLVLSGLVALVVVVGGARLLGARAATTTASSPRRSLLGWRMLITAVLVFALSAAAGHVSAHLAGLLVPVPIITAVMAGFTQREAGAEAAIELLSGLVTALLSFFAFFVVLAATLGGWSAGPAFGLATFATIATWAGLALATRSAVSARP